VGDVETAAGSLVVTATSDDQTLVPDANITLGGSGASRTINVLPGLNQTGGPATITVTVDDGTTTTQTTFDVTVTPDNDAPTITGIADQTPLEDTATGAIAFTIGDVETASGSLIVTATSDDQTLVPDANITLGGSGTNRTIDVLPTLNQNGGPATVTVTVTVTVDDGTTTTQTTFDVTVTAVNDAPVNQVPEAQVTAVDVPVTFNATNGNAVSITEVDSASSPINVSLTGYNGTLTLSGTTGLTFNSGDGTADGAMDFTGTVADINTALDGLVFTPDSGFEGAAGFTIGTDDQGNTGLGGIQGDKSAVFISVGALSYQQGVNGYSGNEDTELQEATPATSFGNATSISIDLDNGGAESQGLIQFSNLFGSGIGQIPFDATIDSASLTVYAFDTSVAATTISLHEMLTAWDETDTWNSTGTGLQRDDVEVSSATDSTMTFADFTGPQTFFGLESTLQAWSDGATNNGWAVFTDSVDGWDFYSSEHTTVAQRPMLTISFAPPQSPSIDLDANDSNGAIGSDFQAAFTEGLGPVNVADVLDAVIADVDSATLQSVTVTLTNALDGADESLTVDTSGTSITASTVTGPGTITLTLSGAEPRTDYESVLRTVQYDNASDDPNTTVRTIEFVVTDQVGLTSNTATSSVTVARTNDDPTGSGSLTATSLNDNDGATNLFGGLTVADVDSGENDLSLTITLTDPAAGTISGGGFIETAPGSGVYTVSGLTTATADTALDNVTFTPTDNTGPSGTFNTDISVTVNDQGGGGEQSVLPATTVTISRINDNPSGSGSLTATSLNDNDGATNLFGGLSVTDVDTGEADLSLAITLTTPSAGTISGGGFTETVPGSGGLMQ
jgi:hypothetical protein